MTCLGSTACACDQCSDTGDGIRLYTVAEYRARPRRPALLDDLLAEQALAVLAGPTGNAKTFLGLDWAASVATGRPWAGLTAHQRPALYVAGEGVDPARFDAWEVAREPIDGLLIADGALNLFSGGDTDLLADIISRRQIGLVVVDTLARAIVGGDENLARDIGQVVGNLDRLRAAGAAVLVLHHTGHDTSRERGSTALRAAADDLFLIKAVSGGRFELTVEKRRDGRPADRMLLELRDVEGTDSAVLTPSAGPLQGWTSLTKNQAEMLTLVHQAGADGYTFGEWLIASGLARSSFDIGRKWLLDNGYATSYSDGTTSRYVATERAKSTSPPGVHPKSIDESTPPPTSIGGGEVDLEGGSR